jgi:hypothetical protein
MRPHRDGVVFALVWLIVMLVPSVLSDLSPHFGRALGATPPLAILAALGLREIWRGVEQISAIAFRRVPRFSNVSRVAGLAVVGLAWLSSGVWTVNDYFNVWANDPRLFTAFEVGLRQTSEYLATLPPDTILSLSPTPRDAPILQFYLESRWDRFKTFNGRSCAVLPYQPANDYIHAAIVADEQQSLAALEAAFPDGQVVHKIFNHSARYAVIYRVPAGARARRTRAGSNVCPHDRIGPASRSAAPRVQTWRKCARYAHLAGARHVQRELYNVYSPGASTGRSAGGARRSAAV